MVERNDRRGRGRRDGKGQDKAGQGRTGGTGRTRWLYLGARSRERRARQDRLKQLHGPCEGEVGSESEASQGTTQPKPDQARGSVVECTKRTLPQTALSQSHTASTR